VVTATFSGNQRGKFQEIVVFWFGPDLYFIARRSDLNPPHWMMQNKGLGGGTISKTIFNPNSIG
jgi:hypothetical protein